MWDTYNTSCFLSYIAWFHPLLLNIARTPIEICTSAIVPIMHAFILACLSGIAAGLWIYGYGECPLKLCSMIVSPYMLRVRRMLGVLGLSLAVVTDATSTTTTSAM